MIVETLRSLVYLEEDSVDVASSIGASLEEVLLMVNYKKILELGIPQLKKFLNMYLRLVEGGGLDLYSMQYYITDLLQGPFRGEVAAFMQNNKATWHVSPDIMGYLGEIQNTPVNTKIIPNTPYPLGAPLPLTYKLPPDTLKMLGTAVKSTEEIFRSSMLSSTKHDNTLPLIDKQPQRRYNGEESLPYLPHANFVVKDSAHYIKVIVPISDPIFTNVMNLITKKDFTTIYDPKKKHNPFVGCYPTINPKLQQAISANGITRTVKVDMGGNEFEKIGNNFKLVIRGEEKEKRYILDSNSGQLGN